MIIKIEAALRRKCDDIDMTNVSPEHESVIIIKKLLNEVSTHNLSALGLAAPQIGIFKNAFIKWNFKTKDWEAYINAKIVKRSKEIVNYVEGCLSLPHRRGVLTDRAKEIEVIDALHDTQTFTDMDAIIMQHEIAHCNGKLIIDFKTRIKDPNKLNLVQLPIEGKYNVETC